jgi:hypothetical protein
VVPDTWAAQAIEAKHVEQSWLGAPVGPVTKTPNGRGYYRHFEYGSIYQHGSSLSAGGVVVKEVHGAIRDKWAELGWENGFLGFPTSDEHDIPGGRASDFQDGQIAWSPELGAAVSIGGDHVRRVVVVDAKVDAYDDEFLGPDEVAHGQLQSRNVFAGPDGPKIMDLDVRAGGEVRVELNLYAEAYPDGNVRITGDLLMYEGDNNSTDDLDGRTAIEFYVLRDETAQQKIDVYSGAGDKGTAYLSVTNTAV